MFYQSNISLARRLLWDHPFIWWLLQQILWSCFYISDIKDEEWANSLNGGEDNKTNKQIVWDKITRVVLIRFPKHLSKHFWYFSESSSKTPGIIAQEYISGKGTMTSQQSQYVESMLVLRCSNVKPTLTQRLVSAGMISMYPNTVFKTCPFYNLITIM